MGCLNWYPNRYDAHVVCVLSVRPSYKAVGQVQKVLAGECREKVG